MKGMIYDEFIAKVNDKGERWLYNIGHIIIMVVIV